MRVRTLDQNHDWTFGQSRHNYLTKSEAIYQNVKTRLLSFRNDWFLDIDHGLPWFEMMEQRKIEQLVKQQVLETEGVQYLTELTLDHNPQTRQTKIRLKYIDIFNENQDLTSQL